MNTSVFHYRLVKYDYGYEFDDFTKIQKLKN